MSHIGKKRIIRFGNTETGKKSRVYLRTAVSKYIVSKNPIKCNSFLKYLQNKGEKYCILMNE